MLKIKYSGKNIDSEILALERPFYRPKLCKDLLKYSEDLNGNFVTLKMNLAFTLCFTQHEKNNLADSA